MPKSKKTPFPIFFYCLFFILLIILVGNILYSQTIPPLYFQFVNNDKRPIIGFLARIKSLSIFNKEHLRYKNEYGKIIDEDVFKKENITKEKIKTLTGLLEKNQNSKDILYGLYLLYKEGGNSKLAGEYLERAKEIDPIIDRY